MKLPVISANFVALALMLLALTACNSTTTTTTPAADTGAGADTDDSGAAADVPVDTGPPDTGPDTVDAKDTNAPVCCKLGTPDCACTGMGGSPSQLGGCKQTCNIAAFGWTQAVDAKGCPYWTAGLQTCNIPKPACDKSPPVFPNLTKECTTTKDCSWLPHQMDCCGSMIAVGVWAPIAQLFFQAENLCVSQYPKCKCAAKTPIAEDGNASETQEFEATCDAGKCMTHVK